MAIKHLLVALLLAAVASFAHAQPTLVGTPLSTYTAASSTSCNATYGTSAAVGDIVVFAASAYNNTATVNTPTSTQVSGGFTQAGTILRATGAPSTDDPFISVFYGTVTTAAAPALTCTFSAAMVDRVVWMIVIRGGTTTGIQTNGAAATVDSETADTGTVTTSGGAFHVSFMREWHWVASHNQNVGTPNTGWTEWGDGANGQDAKYQNFASGGTRNGNFSWTSGGSTDYWVARVVAIPDAGGGGGATQPPRSIHQFRQRGQ